MRAELEPLYADLKALKLNAAPKRWGDPPAGYVNRDGWILTSCIENGRLCLAVSFAAGSESISTNDFLDAVVEVFGEPQATYQGRYPNRGDTTVFQWTLTPER